MAVDRPRRPSPDVPPGGPEVSPAAQRLIAALLALDPRTARAVRARAVRRRPHPQAGPSADYGTSEE